MKILDWFDSLFTEPKKNTIRQYDVWVMLVPDLDIAEIKSESKELFDLISEYLHKKMFSFDSDPDSNRLIIRSLINRAMLPKIVEMVRDRDYTIIVQTTRI